MPSEIGQFLSTWLLADDPEFFAHRRGRVADLIDGLLQFFLLYVKCVGPVLHFVRLVHVDLAAVRLIALGQAIHLFPPLEHGPALGWGLGDETVHRPNGRLALAPMFRSQLGSF